MRVRCGAVPLTLVGILLLATSPAGGAPAKEPPGKPGAGAITRVALLDWTAPVPRTWIAESPKTSMRLARFRVPGGGGAEAAEFAVFYFGAGEGGSAGANIAELSGTYARSLGMGPPAPPTPDQTLLAAIVETPRGNLIFELDGPRATVAASRAAFLGMVRGIR